MAQIDNDADAQLLRYAGLALWRAELPAFELDLSPSGWRLLGAAQEARHCAWGCGAEEQPERPAALPALLACVVAEDREAVFAAVHRLAHQGTPIDISFRVEPAPSLPGQGMRWLRCQGAVVRGTARARAEGVLQDDTERRALAAELQQREADAQHALARARAVLDAVPDLWFVLSKDGVFLELSRPDHPSLALPWGLVQGRRFDEVMPAEVAELASAALARARSVGGVQRTEYRLNTRGGENRAFEARITALADGRWLYLARDITDAQQAQQALHESESRLTRALRGTSDGLWEWEVHSGREYLSPRWKELLGFAPHELADSEHSFFGRLHPDDIAPVRAAVQAHFRHRAPYDIELRLLTHDGQWRWFRSRGEAERDGDGRPVRMAGSISDITVRRGIEDALRDSQARASAMVLTAPVGIALSEMTDGVVVEANDELARILGWPSGRLVGRSTVELGIWPDAGQRALYTRALQRDGRASRPHLLMHHRDGHTVHARLASQLLELGGKTLVLSALTDISDRIEAEAALREQREAYAAVFDAVSDAIVSVDAGGRILLFNPGAERIFQRDAASVHGQLIDVLLPEARRGRHRSDLALLMMSAAGRRGMGSGCVKGMRADRQELDLEAAISRAVVGGRVVLTAILRDVTERVRAEADALRHRFELSALTRELLEQEKLTTQRLAQALHDRLGQTLTALRITLDRQRRAPAAGADETAQRQTQATALVDQAVQEVRQVLVDLRPPLLDEEGLYAALDNEVATRAHLHGAVDLLCEAPTGEQVRRWPGEVEYALFMIGREALDNALRHAGATLVRMALAFEDQELQLEVTDDGVGLAPGAQRPRPGHLGLIGMRERARAIGAVLELGRGAQGGTRLAVRWRPAA